MLDLEKAFRAMQFSREWVESVQAACLFANKEYTPELLQAMTKEFLNDIEYNRTTLEITVPSSIGGALLEAVTQWQPALAVVAPEPEIESQPDILIEEEIIEGDPDA